MTTRRDRKRKGSPQWVRLGELLAARRAELDPAYYDRHVFARDRGVNLKLAQDIENNGRENFTPLTLRDVIAPAYGIEYQSIMAVLDEDGDLVAAPGTPPHRPPGVRRLQPRSPEPAAAQWLPPLDPATIERARPHADAIWQRLRELALQGIANPAGPEVFPDDDADAADWDRRSGMFSVEERVWLIAAIRAREEARERGKGTGTR